MKKTAVALFVMILLLVLASVSEGILPADPSEGSREAFVPEDDSAGGTIVGNMKAYREMADGTWMCDGYTYKYRIEIKGRMPNAAADSCFVYLSNIGDISFEQAYMAAGLSSDSDDYFSPGEAVLVEIN